MSVAYWLWFGFVQFYNGYDEVIRMYRTKMGSLFSSCLVRSFALQINGNLVQTKKSRQILRNSLIWYWYNIVFVCVDTRIIIASKPDSKRCQMLKLHWKKSSQSNVLSADWFLMIMMRDFLQHSHCTLCFL